MSDLYKRIDTLCKERKITITEMCRASGAPRGSLSDLKMGRTNGLNAATLSKIANYFDVAVGYLLGTEEQKEKPATETGSGLHDTGYDQLSPENKSVIDSLIEKLLKSQSGE